MKKSSLTMRLSAAAVALLMIGGPAAGRAQTRYNTQPRGNSIRVDGTSTTHAWEMEGVVIGGYLQLAQGVTLDQNAAEIPGLTDGKVPAEGRAHITVATIHSKAEHLPEVMDDLMQKALKAPQYPTIIFTLTELTPNGTHDAGKPFEFNAAGSLEVAGVTNKVTIPLTISNVEAGRIKISGSVPLKMTSYGVTPPEVSLAGLSKMTCGDDVKISFDWTLKKLGTK